MKGPEGPQQVLPDAVAPERPVSAEVLFQGESQGLKGLLVVFPKVVVLGERCVQ